MNRIFTRDKVYQKKFFFLIKNSYIEHFSKSFKLKVPKVEDKQIFLSTGKLPEVILK